MTYIVKDECIKCKLTDCVDVCPVDCFYEGENMLVINPDECLDCGRPIVQGRVICAICESIKSSKNAVNESIRYINQKEYNFPFNHATETKTVTAGTVRYSLPTSTKHVDYNTFRIVKDEDLATSGGKLSILQYNDYINQFVTQEDEINTTTLDGTLSDSATTINVASTTGFDSTGTLHIGNEEVTYTGTSSTTFTGVSRGANSTTASEHSSGVQVAQFDQGGVPRNVVRSPDNG